jgi:hypothetical protein
MCDKDSSVEVKAAMISNLNSSISVLPSERYFSKGYKLFKTVHCSGAVMGEAMGQLLITAHFST